jgi:hypothetical protein
MLQLQQDKPDLYRVQQSICGPSRGEFRLESGDGNTDSVSGEIEIIAEVTVTFRNEIGGILSDSMEFGLRTNQHDHEQRDSID